MATPKWTELMSMPEEELRQRYDNVAGSGNPGIQFWADVLLWRATMHASEVMWEQGEELKALTADIRTQAEETTKLTDEMRTLTRQMASLTYGMFWTSVAAVVLALVAVAVTILVAAIG